MRRKYLDKISAIILIVFCFIVHFFLIPTQVAKDRLGLSSKFFPELSIFIVGCLSLLLFIKAHFQRGNESDEMISSISREEGFRLIVILALMMLYLVLLRFMGFMISSPLILGLLMYYSGVRNWIIIVPVTLGIPGSIYLFFEKGLKIVLPPGLLF